MARQFARLKRERRREEYVLDEMRENYIARRMREQESMKSLRTVTLAGAPPAVTPAPPKPLPTEFAVFALRT